MSARGDLGFIPNRSGRAPNANFFGSPGHPSKKGVYGHSQVSKINNVDSDNPQADAQVCKLASESMISKRTEYLESQERRLFATITDTRSETNNLAKHLEEMKNEYLDTKTQLYNEIQAVYGKPSQGFLYAIEGSIEDYESKKCECMKTPIEKWAMLIYPMKSIKLNDRHTQSLMRYKQIDPITGQLTLKWVVVYEKDDEKEIRYISEFSLTPN